ncbi:hypothetical protein [Paenibacillus mucilaginosus]|uniref:Uncharacterized protein n=3 Tax=Paenibacillus mucilaginosus TaxID=61624 RepID=H6NFI6_9BACL|nr:hypothetical protein [Paenibacillus mucilaginosus]AEI41535.1 hypothetical protein KNP414_02977 [Paenibacillus mucilaginosus KNP414]AFC30072.1 hypothetical protein PM3016_3217 [Paenibacillus mucilaginosus 3016]AFH62334.1 hypothetical protein B2K_16670 [Paenibacillus mucilaginosus K02]MCG7215426.1 hypothetical protein [Paenibacillus mucilaginosus]WDM30542.1 hypothetical protein KCX80_15925 [Paenibacillus mucilaginosus]
MAYNPQVTDAKVVSYNPKNGLFEIVANLKDRTVCRLTYESDETGGAKATHISRLLQEPCPICRKDFLCNCMDKFKENIAGQALEHTGVPTA